MRTLFLLSLVLFLVPTRAFAGETRAPASVQLEWRDLPLPPECAKAATTIITDFKRCKPMNLQLLVKTADGATLAQVIGLGRNHYHPSEIRGNHLFWVRRGEQTNYGMDGRPSNDIELWVMEMTTKKADKIGEARDLDYRASPSGERVLLLRGKELSLFDRKTATATPIFETASDKNSHAIELRDWQGDGKFSFQVGLGDECLRVGSYHDPKKPGDDVLEWSDCPPRGTD